MVVSRATGSLVIAAMITLAAFVMTPEAAHACSCAQTTLSEYADEMDVAFAGRQIDRNADSDGVTLLLEVHRVYKGQAGPFIEVRTGYGGGDCGTEFDRVGTTGVAASIRGEHGWWVGEKGDLLVDFCSSHVTIDELEDVFGAGYPPDDTISLREEPDAEEPDTEEPNDTIPPQEEPDTEEPNDTIPPQEEPNAEEPNDTIPPQEEPNALSPITIALLAGGAAVVISVGLTFYRLRKKRG